MIGAVGPNIWGLRKAGLGEIPWQYPQDPLSTSFQSGGLSQLIPMLDLKLLFYICNCFNCFYICRSFIYPSIKWWNRFEMLHRATTKMVSFFEAVLPKKLGRSLPCDQAILYMCD